MSRGGRTSSVPCQARRRRRGCRADFRRDGEAAWLGEDPQNGRRLTLLSQSRFGPGRGLDRILGLLAEFDILATFYVSGHTADHDADTVTAILAGGHEVGHHG